MPAGLGGFGYRTPKPTTGTWASACRVTASRYLHTGSKESLFSCTLTASEEAMAVLEEVILYAFQQCVYYVSKVRRAAGSGSSGAGCAPHGSPGRGGGDREGEVLFPPSLEDSEL